MTPEQAALMLKLLEQILRAVEPPKYPPAQPQQYWDGLPWDWKTTTRD